MSTHNIFHREIIELYQYFLVEKSIFGDMIHIFNPCHAE